MDSLTTKRHRLTLALGISLLLHGAALYPGGFSRVPARFPRRAVFAALRMPEIPHIPETPPEEGTLTETPSEEGTLTETPSGGEALLETPDAIIKDTLPEEKTDDPQSAIKKPVTELPKKLEAPKTAISKKSDTPMGKPKKNTAAPGAAQNAQRRLHEHLFYPKEAVERGLEGSVYLIIRFSDDGSILDVDVAASSGHVALDRAAVRAAYAMGRQIGAASSELVLPVRFQLDD